MTLLVTMTIIDFSESNMNNKFLGIKIGTILTVVLSLCFAVLFWLFVKYSSSEPSEALRVVGFDVSRLL